MENPYQVNGGATTGLRRGHPVTLLACVATVLAMATMLTAFPGTYLLIQELEIVPDRFVINDIHINGHSVSNVQIIGWSLACATACALGAASLGRWAYRHYRANVAEAARPH